MVWSILLSFDPSCSLFAQIAQFFVHNCSKLLNCRSVLLKVAQFLVSFAQSCSIFIPFIHFLLEISQFIAQVAKICSIFDQICSQLLNFWSVLLKVPKITKQFSQIFYQCLTMSHFTSATKKISYHLQFRHKTLSNLFNLVLFHIAESEHKIKST